MSEPILLLDLLGVLRAKFPGWTLRPRRDKAERWTEANPVLRKGELGFETDTRKLKIGDGVSTWAALPYSDGRGRLTMLDDEQLAFQPEDLLVRVPLDGGQADTFEFRSVGDAP